MLGQGVLSNKMAGWKEFNQALELRLSEYAAPPTIVTDNYYTAAQIEFAGLSHSTYTIDTDKAVRDGRITQFNLWHKDTIGLAESAGANLLFLTEDSTLNIEEKDAVVAKMCSLSSTLSWDSSLWLFGGDKRFSIYTGSLPKKAAAPNPNATCPYPARAWLDSPPPNAELSGVIEVAGWAFNQAIGIADIRVLIDGSRVSRANYGQQRQDVAAIYSSQTLTDPNSPMLGFSARIDTDQFSTGRHQLELEIVSNNGEVSRYGKRALTVRRQP
jgi:hypothetical protein